MKQADLFGRVVISKCGRDKGSYQVIVGFFEEDILFVADGGRRKVENPKKKKMKHLIFTDKSLALNSEGRFTNPGIKKAIKELNKEKKDINKLIN